MKVWRSLQQLLARTQSPKASPTVRYMFPILLGFMVFLGANALPSTQSSYIRLEVEAGTIRAGERFSLDVLANAHVPVNAVDITLSFDAKNFEVISVDRGQSVLTIWTEEPIITNNSVTLRGGTFRRGFLGEHKIASIILNATETGQGEFVADEVTLLAGDGRGTPIKVSQVDDSSLSLFIYDENTSPDDIGANVTVTVLTDLDGDGTVSLRDISAFMSAWVNPDQTYDFNGDGKMTFKDFSIILSNFFFQ